MQARELVRHVQFCWPQSPQNRHHENKIKQDQHEHIEEHQKSTGNKCGCRELRRGGAGCSSFVPQANSGGLKATRPPMQWHRNRRYFRDERPVNCGIRPHHGNHIQNALADFTRAVGLNRANGTEAAEERCIGMAMTTSMLSEPCAVSRSAKCCG